MRGSGALVSSMQVAPDFDLGHDRRLRVETLIFHCRHHASRVVGGSLHCLLQLDFGLSSGYNSLIRVTLCFRRYLYMGERLADF